MYYRINHNALYFPEYQSILLNSKNSINSMDIKDEYPFTMQIEKYVNKRGGSKSSKKKESCNIMPLSIYLFPTSECTLRCKYCFSNAGENVVNCKLNKTQINSIIREAVKTAAMKKLLLKDSVVDLEIWFGGGGEPTYDWELICYAVETAKVLASKNGIIVNFGIVTNGFISDENKLRFFIDEMSHIQVSIDGHPNVQNEQRPTADGKESSDVVDSFIKIMLANRKHVALRSTVSNKNVNEMVNSTEYFLNNFPGITHIHYEPISLTRRSSINNYYSPIAKDFADNLIKSMIASRRLNGRVTTSVAAIRYFKLNDSFCDAMTGASIMIQPNGYFTSCFEAMPNEIDNMSPFVLGRINTSGTIEWAINNILKSKKFYDDNCKSCLCWHYCKGGCAIVRYRGKESFEARCQSTKLVSALILKNIAIGKADDLGLCVSELNITKDDLLFDKIYTWDEGVFGAKHSKLIDISKDGRYA